MIKNKAKSFLKNVKDSMSLDKALEHHQFDVEINGIVIDISCDKSIEEYLKKDSQCLKATQNLKKAVKLQE
jgi:hypothetical protein